MLIAAQGMASSEVDPTRDLHGWDQVAAALRESGFAVGRGYVCVHAASGITAGIWHLRWGREVPVFCYSATNAHGYAQWSRPADWVGRDGILVVAQRSFDGAAGVRPLV